MNLKKAKVLRKETAKLFGPLTVEKRQYQTINNVRCYDRDKDGKTVFSGLGPGTVLATGARRMYQDTKRKISRGELYV